jgi:sulfite exporter TauE/SafE
MRFEQKLAAAFTLLEPTGIWRSNYAPPVYRLLWRLGARVAPPHFVGFVTNFLIAAVSFGAVWGLLMCFAVWSHQAMSPRGALVTASCAGLCFGLFMATYYRYGTWKHEIPLWRDFRPPDEHAHLTNR